MHIKQIIHDIRIELPKLIPETKFFMVTLNLRVPFDISEYLSKFELSRLAKITQEKLFQSGYQHKARESHSMLLIFFIITKILIRDLLLSRVLASDKIDKRAKGNIIFIASIMQMTILKFFKYTGRGEEYKTLIKRDFKSGNFQKSVSSNYDDVQEDLLSLETIQ